MKRIVIVALLAIAATVAAKPTYKITLKVEGNNDSIMLLGYNYAQHTYLLDSARNNGHGKFVFEGDREMHPGLYFITNNGNRYIEFVIYHEQPFFTLSTQQSDWVEHMKVKGSKQNEIMFDYQRANAALYDELSHAEKSLDSAALAAFRANQYRRLDSLKLALVEQHPNAMIGKMIFATKDVDVPRTNADGTPMTDRQRYDWFMAHYFDNMPVDDDFIVRTPKAIFYQRVMDYMDRYMRGMPPSAIIPLLDSLIDRAEPAPEVYKWLVHTTTEHFLQSPVMVYDEVYVHLAKRYYASGKAFWASPTVIDEQIERANKWERLLVGREAPELILFDTLRRAHSLHHMPGRYTLLLFWSPTCGHCRDIIPALYNSFNALADSLDMTAFSILTEPDESTLAKWKAFLVEHHMDNPRWVHLSGAEANVDWREVYDVTSTPQVYLIDNRDHTFIAKKLNADLFDQICRTLNRN